MDNLFPFLVLKKLAGSKILCFFLLILNMFLQCSKTVISFIMLLGELVVYYRKCKSDPCIINSNYPLKVQDEANLAKGSYQIYAVQFLIMHTV